MNHAAPPHDRADASLREEQLRLIIDSAREYAIITLDLEGRVTSWNTGAERILGFAEGEILGRSGEVFFTPEDRAAGAPEREMRLAREEGRAANERWHLRKDGSRFWGSGVMLPLSDGRGYLKIFRDRTEERLAEERLQARTAELEAVLATVPVAVWFTYDPDAHHAVGNRQAEILMRLPPAGNVSLTAPESERPRHFRVFRDGAEADPATLPLQRAARGEEAESEEEEIRFSDGSAITVLVQARPLSGGDGRVIGAVCTAVDITERKRFEEALKESEEKFRQLADNIPTLAWMADPDGSIFWYNRRWYEYTGTTPDRMLGWGWQAVHDPAVLPGVMTGWKESIASGREFEMVFPLRGADGVFRPFLTRGQPLRDGRGRVCRWFGTNTDIAEQKRAERHQRLLINELNHRVKNTLATVQSLAMQTFRADDPDRDARAVFQERLMALARAHDVLTRESWEGANLHDIVAQAIEPHRDGADRFEIEGPDLRLSPRMALTLAMALSELATNAAKYGALSTETGRVAILWALAGEAGSRRLRLRWEERGGPPVQPPTRRGFGSRLIERALAREIGGEVRIDYAPAGAVCTLDAPLPAAGIDEAGTGG